MDLNISFASDDSIELPRTKFEIIKTNVDCFERNNSDTFDQLNISFCSNESIEYVKAATFGELNVSTCKGSVLLQ